MKRLNLSIIILLVFATTYLMAQNPCVKLYTMADGLPGNNVSQIFQDSKKFIWFASDGGLVRYDGSAFTRFGIKEGLSAYRAFTISEDSYGRIWINIFGGKFNFLYKDKIYTEKDAPFLDSLTGFGYRFQDTDNILYFSNREGICTLDTLNRTTKYSFPEIGRIWGFHKTKDEGFLIGTNQGLFQTSKLSEKPVKIADSFYDPNYVSKDNKTIFISDIDTITNEWFFVKYYDGAFIDSTICPIQLTSLGHQFIEDSSGLIWICLMYQGVFCMKDKRIVYHFDIKGATEIIEDHEGNIWISAKKGVYKINPCFLSYKHYDNSNFQDEPVDDLSLNPGGGVWCVNEQTMHLLKENKFYELDFQLDESSFYWVKAIKNNSALVGYNGRFVAALEGLITNPTTRKIHYSKQLFDFRTTKCLVDKTETEIKLMSGKGIIKTYSPERQFELTDSIDLGVFCGIFYDARNNMVINAGGKFYIWKDEKIPYTEFDDLNDKILYSHIVVNDSCDLFYVADESLYLINNSIMYNLSDAFDYPLEERIINMWYHEPSLYLSTSKNIYKCNNPLDVIENKPVHLQLIDLRFPNIHDIIVDNDSLFVATDEGLTVIPEALIRNISTSAPIPYFKSVVVNEKESIDLLPEIKSSSKNSISFIFGCINYSSSPVIFSYRLVGADTLWKSGTINNVAFENLQRGKYNLQVRVRKPTSPWSNPIECRIIVHATFWQHPLFIIGLFLLFGALLSVVIIRRKNIQIKRKELDHQLVLLEQKALQAMMNPHFIFNALGSIQNYLLLNQSADAGLYLSQFARLIRQNLNAINTGYIRLEEEVDRLKNYLDLEKMRLEDKFVYTIKVDEDVEEEDALIPSMIIQPFVENSIWHGISTMDMQGTIDISFSVQSQHSVRITVEDNGIGVKNISNHPSKSQEHLNLGSEMTRRRLEMLGKKHGIKTSVDYSEMTPGNINPGTRVVLVVPLSYSSK